MLEKKRLREIFEEDTDEESFLGFPDSPLASKEAFNFAESCESEDEVSTGENPTLLAYSFSPRGGECGDLRL